MERISYRLHVRFVSVFAGILNSRARLFMEYLFLFLAFISLLLLVNLHTHFVDDKDYSKSNFNKCVKYSVNGSLVNDSVSIFNSDQYWNITSKDPPLPVLILYKGAISKSFSSYNVITETIELGDLNSHENYDEYTSHNNKRMKAEALSSSYNRKESMMSWNTRKYLFSLNKGDDFLLSLFSGNRDKSCNHHEYGIDPVHSDSVHSTEDVIKVNYNFINVELFIDPNSSCFDFIPNKWMFNSIIGHDTLTILWIWKIYGEKGFLYNLDTKQFYDLKVPIPKPSDNILNKILFKMNAVGSTIFLFFSTSSLVSYTLRETQARMLKFTYLLQHHIQHNLPISGIIFTHVTESLLFVPMMVGLLFFLREFFRDQIIAFTVLSLVWCVEVFAIISLRTAIATNFFPRLFCIYLSFYLLYT